MAVIVQSDDGTVSGANAYITVDEFKVYHEARLNTFVDDDERIEAAIIHATDYLDVRFTYVGRRLQPRDQTTEWPRVGAYDRDRHYVNGVPREVKDATAEYALRAMTQKLNPDIETSTTASRVTMEKNVVGDIEKTTQYAENGGKHSLPKYPAADNILRRAGLVVATGEVRRG